MDASNRQERLQMRQRGAGTRKINAVEFGISFDPTPQNSARNTPQPASQRRQVRTPLTAKGAPRRSSKTPSKVPNHSATAEDPLVQGSVEASRSRLDVYDGRQEGSEPRAQKRRKLSSDQEDAHLVTPVTSQASVPGLFEGRSQRGGKSSTHHIEIAEEPEPDPAQWQPSAEVMQPVAGSSPSADKENTVPGTQIKMTPRLALTAQMPSEEISSINSRCSGYSRSSSRQSENMSMISATGDVGSESELLVAFIEESADESLNDDQEGVSLSTAQGGLIDTSMELVTVLQDTNDNEVEAEHAGGLIDPQLLTEDPAEISTPRSANIKKKRSSPKKPGPPSREREISHDLLQPSSDAPAQQASPDLRTPHQSQPPTPPGHTGSNNGFYQNSHDDGDETYLQPTSPVIPTPKAVAKKPGMKKRKVAPRRASRTPRTSTTQNAGPKRQADSATFPIITYRHVNTVALPAITEEAEPGEEEGDGSGTEAASKSHSQLATFRKFHDRPTPNAVDVLAQFCREDIEAAFEAMATARSVTTTTTTTTTSSGAAGGGGGGGGGGRAALQHKRAAIRNFSAVLESRLFDLSAAVEHRSALQARVKQSERDKREMQARWREVRSEREAVALRLDDVRRKKAEREREDDETRALSEMLFRLELEFEYGPHASDGGGRGAGGGGGGAGHSDPRTSCTESSTATRHWHRKAETRNEALEWNLTTLATDRVSGRPARGLLLDRLKDFNAVLDGVVAILDNQPGTRLPRPRPGTGPGPGPGPDIRVI